MLITIYDKSLKSHLSRQTTPDGFTRVALLTMTPKQRGVISECWYVLVIGCRSSQTNEPFYPGRLQVPEMY